MGVNYGLNKVRFTAPVPVGSRLARPHDAAGLRAIDNGGVQMTVAGDVEREGGDKPVWHRGVAVQALRIAGPMS